jgi:anaerobic selenocysteine-containing dehydrogenase
MSRLAYRTCTLCEATCGLEIEVNDDNTIGRIRGDRDDVFSHGYICPKGSTLKQLHEDPDRVRTPLVRGDDGELHPATWDEAFAEVERRLMPILEKHGRDAAAVYLGNPNAHNLSGLLYGRFLIRALGTSNLFSASTVDQRPKEVTSGLMFGSILSHPLPDLDRTDYLLILGANPYESNGSLATAPDWPGRLEAIIERGGRVVVVDPKRTKTAEHASEHVPIRPGTDAQFLFGIVNVLFEEGLVDLGTAAEYVNGVDEVRAAAADFTPDAVSALCGIGADTIRRLARELAAAPTAAVYGRIGTCTQEFGTLASWLVDVINTLTGNLDRPGGAMWCKAAAGGGNTRGEGRVGRGVKLHRRHSRVRGLPETYGEIPVACLSEEIETPGDGQIRALFTVGGNPASSTPNSGRLAAALQSLELLVSIDIYVNETTRFAHVIFPAPSVLTKGHYDIGFYQMSIRNIAKYSLPVVPAEEGSLDEWRTICKLALIAQGAGADADPSIIDDMAIRGMAESAGRDPDEVVAELAPRVGPERLLDFMLRTGPYKLTLDELIAAPHGVDLGPLEPRLPEVLRTPSGMIELAPELLLSDVPRLRESLDRHVNGDMVLIGRRHLRSNNSWMHTNNVLVKGKPRCTLQVHPDDAARLGLGAGGSAKVESRAGWVIAPVEVTDALMPGVVSLPHGWGQNVPGAKLSVAREVTGSVNFNVLADENLYDPISGNAVLNGIPVTVTPA